MGPMLEDLTHTLRGLDDGHPELLFWGYVDTDVKDDPSDGGYNFMNSRIFIFSLMVTTLISLISSGAKYQYKVLLFDHVV